LKDKCDILTPKVGVFWVFQIKKITCVGHKWYFFIHFKYFIYLFFKKKVVLGGSQNGNFLIMGILSATNGSLGGKCKLGVSSRALSVVCP
jgi:hypothetical protein